MRLIAIIVLTSLIALTVLPKAGMSGMTGMMTADAMHDCLFCPETGADTDGNQTPPQRQVVPCADMALCAPAVILSEVSTTFARSVVRPRHVWPEPSAVTTVNLSLDLPPPRAWS